MKDVVLKKIELNEQYHRVKENLAWTATSVYLAFSVGTMTWLWQHSLDCDQVDLARFFLGIVFLSALAFVRFQFKHRWQSVYEADTLNALLGQCTPDSTIAMFPARYAEALEAEKVKKNNRRSTLLIVVLSLLFPVVALLYLLYRILGGKKDIVDSRYHTEIPTYGLMTFSLLAQLLLT